MLSDDSTPIWTAFITHFVTSPRWIKDGRSKNIVNLSDLKRHIFSSQYTPDLSPGVHFLDFDLAKGKCLRFRATHKWDID